MPRNTPREKVTKQMWNEGLHIFRGKDKGRPVWHYVVANVEKITSRKCWIGDTVDMAQIGQLVKYRNELGRVEGASGWGTDPPDYLQKWLQDSYGMKLLAYICSFSEHVFGLSRFN